MHPEVILGLMLCYAALEDSMHRKIFDGYGVVITCLAVTSTPITVLKLLVAGCCVALSFYPKKRPTWGEGDGFLIASLSLYYSLGSIALLLSLSTGILLVMQISLSRESLQPLPLAPALAFSWLISQNMSPMLDFC